MTTPQPTEALKNDQDKIHLEYYPPEARLQAAEIMGFGAKKYGPWNYRKGMAWLRMWAACERHLDAWRMGEDNDPETGKSHLAHAHCCIAFLQYYASHEEYVHLDDRPKTKPTQQTKE